MKLGRAPIHIADDGTITELVKHKAFQDSTKKRKILVAHRRGRKTSMSLEEMVKYLVTNPGIIGKTLAPIRKQAKEIIWDDPDMLFKIFPREEIKAINNSELKVEFKNGSLYYLDGADDPNYQRGGNVKVLHMAESGDHREEVWSSVYEPVLTLNKGVAIFEGNPRGQNWYYRLYEQAGLREGWDRFLISAKDTPIFTSEQLEDIRISVPENVYKAEYLCEWVGSTGTVFRTIRQIATGIEATAVRGRKYRIGIDLARQQDFTVLSIVDKHTWKQVKKVRFNQLDWGLIKDQIKLTIMEFSNIANENDAEVLIEDNGIGDPVYFDIWRWSAEVNTTHSMTIIPFKTTNASKALLVSNFSILSDTSQIEILNDEIQIKEFERFTFKKNALHYIYSAPDGEHDDTVMATTISFWKLGEKLAIPEEEHKYTRYIDKVAALNHVGEKDSMLESYLL